jgi:hypothetical protein
MDSPPDACEQVHFAMAIGTGFTTDYTEIGKTYTWSDNSCTEMNTLCCQSTDALECVACRNNILPDDLCDAHADEFPQFCPTPWQAAGTLAQLETSVQEFPFTEWTYGVRYNHGWGDVHDIVLNSWNRGVRVSVAPFYPQGDNAEQLAFGTTVFTRDTDGQTPGEWIQNYYRDDQPVHSNGNSNSVQVFRKRLPHAWQEVGTLADLESTIAEYPLTEWTYGVQYNHGWGDIHDIVINSWNQGIRVSAYPFYPQGDNAAQMSFGTTVFTRDTAGQTPGEWIQYYYQDGRPAYHSNGQSDHVRVFRQRLSSEWQAAGTLAQFESTVAEYPFTE